ncbi:hypothetical protein NDU88_005341 [Pleurodeles waltl]|uniref:Uncharacterized protein n=1 Tax=Pleurodeles waltl TaxID=8319 RepID=A0AAV7QI21_PLEWA|nr:hypothetical protein NDU88_005341 [Pleurodeles waltl]
MRYILTVILSHLLDVDDSDDDDGPFGAAHSLSELTVKYQEEDEDGYYEPVYEPQQEYVEGPKQYVEHFQQFAQAPSQECIVQVLMALVEDLQGML